MSSSIDSPELFFAIVVPVGADRGSLLAATEYALKSVGYHIVHISLSKMLIRWTDFSRDIPLQEDQRIQLLQNEGNRIRASISDGAILARAAIQSIREHRETTNGDQDRIAGRIAYVLDQLKHPEEVELLRRVYGKRFFLIGGHSLREDRMRRLADKIASSNNQSADPTRFVPIAAAIMDADEKQSGEFEQNTRDTYPKADLFVDLSNPDAAQIAIIRFVELVFGHPFHTPSPMEYSMFQAGAAASDRQMITDKWVRRLRQRMAMLLPSELTKFQREEEVSTGKELPLMDVINGWYI
jgi:hypothetical protein